MSYNYKICFITTLVYGEKTIDLPGVFEKIDKYDYYIFSNHKLNNTSWEVIDISNIHIKNNIVTARYFKFNGWKYLKDKLNKEYDVIFCCDGFQYPDINVDWQLLAHDIINADFSFMQSLHQKSNLHNGSILNECKLIVKFQKDTKENMDNMVKWMKEKYPHIELDKVIFYENTSFGYSPNNKLTCEFLEHFYSIYSSPDFPTYRDQPLWSLLLKDKNLKPVHIKNMKARFSLELPLKGTNNHNLTYYNK
jgi:hypothetical protein